MHAMLMATIGNSIYWRYVSGQVSTDTNPVVLEVKWFTQSQLQKASEITIEYKNEANETVVQNLTFLSCDGDNFFFHPHHTSVTLSENVEKNLILEYDSGLNLKFIEQDDKGLYAQKVMLENNTSSGSLATRMRKAVQTEPPESRNILRFMLELNNKLDDILSLLKGAHPEDGTRNVRTVGVSATGFILHDDSLIPDGTCASTTCTIGDGEDRLIFSALLEISQIKPSETGIFYNAAFIHLKQELVDGIVKYLFSKEREMIKGIKEL